MMAVAETREANEVRTEKGMSLARGPALILGTILLAAGLYFLYRQHTFPKFSNFPNGKAPVGGKVLGVFGANGWTGMLTAIAGGLLLFGAAQHLVAKAMSLVAGVALGAAAVIALISGDVLGLAAANGWTELAWGIAAAILLFNTVMPRRRRTVAEPGVTRRGRRAGRSGAAVADRDGDYAGEPAPRDPAEQDLGEREQSRDVPVERQRDRAVGERDTRVAAGERPPAGRDEPA
jgi:hypothetical protein